MPTVLREGPYRFSFFAQDRDEPPHVHVTHERNEAKYWLEPIVRLARNNGFRPHELTEIERILEEHRQQLVETWNEYFNQ